MVSGLAAWIERRFDALLDPAGPAGFGVVGFDGPAEIGATGLADAVAEALRRSGRPVVRASTAWWWRPAALRLELGRQDVDMLLTGWVDADALGRELLTPFRAGQPHITRLRHPETGRPVREPPEQAAVGSILLLDGPFLLAAAPALDGVIGLKVGRGSLMRALPDDRQWWVAAFERYQADYRPAERADVLLSYDHPSAPAVSGLPVRPLS